MNYELLSNLISALSWLAIAATVGFALRQRGALKVQGWLALGAVALAAGRALAIVETFDATALVWETLRVCSSGLALAALVEYGRRNEVAYPQARVGRVVAALVVVASLPATFTGFSMTLELITRVLLAWQGVLIAGPSLQSLWSSRTQANAAWYTRFAAIGLVLFAAVLASTNLVVAGLTLATALAAWLTCRETASKEQRISYAWRWHSPVAFALLIVAGAAALPRAHFDANQLAADDTSISAESLDMSDMGVGGLDHETASNVKTQLYRCGLALLPILALILIVALLAQLPALR